MAAKNRPTYSLCHSIPLSYVNVDLEPNIEESSVKLLLKPLLLENWS